MDIVSLKILVWAIMVFYLGLLLVILSLTQAYLDRKEEKGIEDANNDVREDIEVFKLLTIKEV